jgi:hypothetical protein
MTRAEALAAIGAELARLAPALPPFEGAAPDIRERLTALVVAGACTAAQAAEALALAIELTYAEERGDIPVPHGLALMEQLGDRHTGEGGTN